MINMQKIAFLHKGEETYYSPDVVFKVSRLLSIWIWNAYKRGRDSWENGVFDGSCKLVFQQKKLWITLSNFWKWR